MRRAIIAALAGVVTAAALATAAQAGTIQVSGTQSAPQADGSYVMSGSLVGVWWTTSFVLQGVEPSGGVQGSGTETFIGCLDTDAGTKCGWIDFSFTFTAKYDPTFTSELHGRCHHPVVGGGGDFEGVSGVLDFKDDPVTGCSYYRGHLTLG